MSGASDDVEDAVDLALLVGNRADLDALLGGFVRVSSGTDITARALTDELDELSPEVAETFFDFLETRGYIDAGSDSADVEYESCMALIVDARRARRVLDTAAEGSTRQSFELVCTLPNRDPAFADRDPVDFRMQQITSRLLSLCREAQESLLVVSPYLELSGIEWLVPGLEGALERGVDVTLVSRELEPGEPNYEAIRSLVEVATGYDGELAVYDYYEHDPDTDRPLYTLHSKVLIADDDVAYIGSANFTKYGFSENLEVGVVLTGDEVAELCRLVDYVVANGGRSIKLP